MTFRLRTPTEEPEPTQAIPTTLTHENAGARNRRVGNLQPVWPGSTVHHPPKHLSASDKIIRRNPQPLSESPTAIHY